MDNYDSSKRTDEDLVLDADKGLRGQGAVVESMNRLKKSIEDLNITTSFYSKIIIGLTFTLLILALIQIILLIKN